MTKFKQQMIRVPEQAEKILTILTRAGYEAFVVGGCVRDCLLGRQPVDWDITTSALPSEVKSLFSHTVDTGIEHGTVMVLMGGSGYEVTTYRKDGKYSDARRPDEVEFTPSLEEDLKRRDFTINAFAWNAERGLVDLFDGLADLKNGVIRCVGDPDKRFSEDALRIMRAVRFAAQLSFRIEDETYDAIGRHADNLGRISMERIRVEFEKTLVSPNPSYVNLYKELGLAPYIIREDPCRKEVQTRMDGLSEMRLCDRCFLKESEALYDALAVSADRKEEAWRKELPEEDTAGLTSGMLNYLRLAAFFQKLTPEEAAGALRRLTYDNRTKKIVSSLLKHKDDPIPPDRRIIRRALHQMGPEILTLVWEYKLAERRADASLKAGALRCFEMRDDEMLADAIEVTEDVLRDGDPYEISMLAVDGNDLIEAGVPKGKAIGQTLAQLLQVVMDDPGKNRKEVLLGLVENLE